MHNTVNILMLCLLSMNMSYASKEMSNKHFRIAAYEWEPYVSLDKAPNGTYELGGGVLVNFFKFMQRARNFTYTIVREPNGIWGNCVGKQNCTGMIGMVLRDEVDFALGSFPVNNFGLTSE